MFAKSDSADRPCCKVSVFMLLGITAALTSGCANSIRQYTRLSDWDAGQDKARIISASPDRDGLAYHNSSDHLSKADWRVLERFAPRPIWDKIADAKRRLANEDEDAPKASEEDAAAPQSTPAPAPAPRRVEAPCVVQPDGKVKMFYRLQHVGGVSVSTAYDGGTRRRSIKSTTADLRPWADLVKQHLGGDTTVATVPAENMLVITCDADLTDAAAELMARLDSPSPQVEISARIFEVSSDFDFQYGAKTLIRHLSGDNQQGLAANFSAAGFAGQVSDPIAGTVPDPGSAFRLMQVFQDAGLSLDATFQALVDTGLVELVAAPRMTVRCGDTGKTLAGRELPIQEAKIVSDNFASERVTYKPIGVQLYITPQAVGDDSVKMHVVASVSAVAGFDVLPSLDGSDGSTMLINPIIDSREAETYVTVPADNTLVISGLRMTRSITRERKIPGLGDIPGLGWLFKSHRSQNRVNDLYFFVTPHIIQ